MDSTSYTLYVRCGDERLGAVPVCVTRKRVRNLNLRVRGDGSVVASVPWRTSRARAQEFLDAHAGWIAERVSRKAERQAESRETAPAPASASHRRQPDAVPKSRHDRRGRGELSPPVT